MTTERFPHRLVRASAGSGKTFALVHRFIGLLAAGVEPRRVLATTFTRKAAGEILERVMDRLAGAALDPAIRDALNEHLPDGLALDAAGAELLLGAVARALPDLQVETLDAFFHRIAAGHAFELGLPPGWGIGDAATLAKLRRRAIADLLEEDPDAAVELVRRLSKGDVRRGVVAQVDGLVDDLHHHWLESPREAWDRFAVPEPPGAMELAAAREALEGIPLPLTKAGAPHKSWSGALDAILLALDEDAPERLAGITLVQRVIDGEPFASQEIPSEWGDALAAPLALARRRELDRLRGQNLASRELMERYDALERRRRDEAGRYDFGTVTRLLAESRYTEQLLEVYERLDGRIDHVLLDEFQDTSRLQYVVLAPVIADALAREGEKTFFCVGDVKQAIYGWRGGCRALFGVVEELAGGSEALDRNWRSSPVVLRAVERVFGEVEHAFVDPDDRATARAWRDDFHPHEAARPERPGFVELRVAERAEGEEGLVEGDLPFERAIESIRAIHEADPSATVGVLLRRNDRVRSLIDRLRGAGIDASEEGGNPLDDSPAVSRVLSQLLLADHPGDRCELYSVVRTPSSDPACPRAERDPRAAAEAARRLREELLSDGYGATVGRLAAALAPACGARDRARLAQLVELAHRFGDETGLRPGDFVERVRRTPVESPTGAPVVVMTIHGAKGLEFDAVVLPQLTDPWSRPPPTLLAAGSDPVAPPDRLTRYLNRDLRRLCRDAIGPIYAGHRATVITEALDLLYVALTRARHAVHLFLPPGKLGEGASFARVLRVMLGGERAEATEGTLFEAGDRDWLARRPAVAKPGPARTPIAAPRRGLESTPRSTPVAAATPARAGAPSKRGWDLERDDGERLGATPGSRAALRFGTTVHQLLEGVEWLDGPGARLGAMLDEASAALPVVALPHLAAGRTALERALAAPEGRAALSCSAARRRLAELAGEPVTRVDVLREVGYVRAEDAGAEDLDRGAIDRLHLGYGETGAVVAAEIIDAKTEAAEGAASAESLIDRYREQLLGYRGAVSALYVLAPERIGLALLRVPSGEHIPI